MTVGCFNAVGGKNFPLKDSVLFKYQGTQVIMAETARLVEEVSIKYGGADFLYFGQEKDADEIWNLRKSAFPHLARQYHGYKGLVTDAW